MVAKPISVVGAARVCLMSLNCSKTWGEDQNSAYHGAKQRAYLCKQIKKKKNNKKQDQRPPYQEKRLEEKRPSVNSTKGWLDQLFLVPGLVWKIIRYISLSTKK